MQIPDRQLAAIAQAAHQIAIDHFRAARYADAEAACRRILELDPDHPDALNLLGLVASERGNPLLAVNHLDQAIAVDPRRSAFHANRGEVLRRWGMPDAARISLQRALDLDPASAQAHNNMGLVYLAQNRLHDAVASFERAVQHDPAMVEAHCNLGRGLRARGEFARALQYLNRAVELDPGHAQSWFELGCVYEQTDEPGRSGECCRRALALNPGLAEAHVVLGNAHLELGEYEQATAAYRAAIACNPNFPPARYQLALARLTVGDFAEGWAQFESRFDAGFAGAVSPPLLPMPMWNGDDISGKTLLVLTEQGYGDHIQFCRLVRPLAERGVRIVMGASPPLLELMRTLPGVSGLLSTVEEAWFRGCDCWTFVASLPYRLGVGADSTPADTPYLGADPARAAKWRERLARWGGKLKVGLFWAGRATHANDRRRSMALAQLAPLAAVPEVVFVSLQRDQRIEEALDPPAGMELIACGEELQSFADTAALLGELDLLITVDSAAAHLAGALRRPVWTLLPFRPDWRWHLEREDSPWYPGMRLFRQPRRGDWASVVERVAGELRALAATRTAQGTLPFGK